MAELEFMEFISGLPDVGGAVVNPPLLSGPLMSPMTPASFLPLG